MFFKIILISTILLSNLTFSSEKDSQNQQRQAISTFYSNIDWMKNFLSLPVSFVNPNLTSKTSKLPENTHKWLKSYMPRFYNVETNFRHIDSIIQIISRENPTIDAEYKAIQSIKWDNVDMTYEELQTNLANLVQFYKKYKTEIQSHASCTLQPEDKTPSIVSNNTEKPTEKLKPQPDLNKNNSDNYKIIIAKLKNYIVTFFKGIYAYITNKFYTSK